MFGRTSRHYGYFRKPQFLAVFLLFIALITGAALFNPDPAQAAIPKLINFQGKITQATGGNIGANVADGTYSMQFKLYDALTSGSLLWTETYDQPSGSCAKPTLTNGVFNVKLGTCNALTIDFNPGSLFLTINFAPTGVAYDGEMSPRKQLLAAAYAFNANNLVGDGRIDNTYAPADATNPAAKHTYNPSVSSSNNALSLSANNNVSGAGLLVTHAGTGVGLQLAGAGAAARTIKSDGAALVLQTTTSGNITLDPQTGIVAGAAGLTIRSGGATALALDSGGAAALNLGITNATSVVIGRASQTLQLKSFASIAANGVLYLSDTSGTVAETAASTGTQCLVSASAGAAPTWGSCGGGSSPFTTTAGVISQTTATEQLNLIMGEAGDYGLRVTTSLAPTVDLVQIDNTSATTTNGVDALVATIRTATGAGANNSALHAIINNAPVDASDILNGLEITGAAQTVASTTQNLVFVDAAASGNTAGTLNGLRIDTITTPGAAAEIAISLGSGWDQSLQLTATDNTGSFTIADACAASCVNGTTTPNKLLELRDLSTNFGASLLAGAFIELTSTIKEEFNRQRTSLAVDTTGGQNGAFGNGGGWGVYEGGTTPNCTFSSLADSVNGITRMAASGVASGCLMMMDEALNNAKLLYNVANLPVFLMKMKPGQADANSAVYAGMADSTDGLVAAPTNFIGFSNNNAGTLGNTWIGTTRNANTQTTVVCTGQTISTTQYAVLMVEVRASNSVRFWIDTSAADGINFTECGSGSSTNIPAGNLAPELHWQELTGGSATNSQLDLDYFRSWQDDSPSPAVEGLVIEETPLLPFEARAALATLVDNKQAAGTDQSETGVNLLTADRLLAGLEVITPEVWAEGLTVDSVTALNKEIIFNSDITLFGRPYFNKDTAGLAEIQQGDTSVDIIFDKEYLEQPIVTVSLTMAADEEDDRSARQQAEFIDELFDDNIRYLVVNKNEQGFTIILSKSAPQNLMFSWVALAVKDVKAFTSRSPDSEDEEPQSSPDPEPQVAGDSTVIVDEPVDPPAPEEIEEIIDPLPEPEIIPEAETSETS